MLNNLLDPYLLHCTKTKTKGIKDLNMKPEMLKQQEENLDSTLQDIGVRNDFPNRTPLAQELR